MLLVYNVFMLPEAVFIGFLSGYLSGQFGIGGGIIATPLLRLWLGLSPFFSIGTTLPPIIPGALLAAFNFYRAGFKRFFEVKKLAFFGFFGVLAGAGLVKLLGGKFIMLLTSVIVILVSINFIFKGDSRRGFVSICSQRFANSSLTLAFLGLLTGSYSALLGLGGGFVLIPGLIYFRGLEIKEAISVSLMTTPLIVLPASLFHFWLGDINWLVTSGLLFGVLPGSFLGSKIALKLNSRLLEKLFGLFLLLIGLIFLASELGGGGN